MSAGGSARPRFAGDVAAVSGGLYLVAAPEPMPVAGVCGHIADGLRWTPRVASKKRLARIVRAYRERRPL